MAEPIIKRCAGLDVHKMRVTATILLEHSDGSLEKITRQFGTFHTERLVLAEWLKGLDIELAVMESTGIYWKSIFTTLEEARLNIYVVNARPVKQVPRRKTDEG